MRRGSAKIGTSETPLNRSSPESTCMSDRINISSGSPYEAQMGYSRAVRKGDFVFVSGTTAGDVGENAADQAREVFRRIGAALEQAGASLSDVVRTRVYLADIADFDAVGDVHGEVFGEIRPSIVILAVAGLAAPGLKVEIEADALI